jgi:hypothetical protein
VLILVATERYNFISMSYTYKDLETVITYLLVPNHFAEAIREQFYPGSLSSSQKTQRVLYYYHLHPDTCERQGSIISNCAGTRSINGDCPEQTRMWFSLTSGHGRVASDYCSVDVGKLYLQTQIHCGCEMIRFYECAFSQTWYKKCWM